MTAVERPPLRSALEAAVAALGLRLSASQVDQLLGYLDLLSRWNRTYNLTAVRDPQDMLTQHVVDSLAALPSALRACPQGHILDVGSGGGLPGVVWAIAEPAIDVTCVDSVGKKAAFVQQVATELRLPQLHSRHTRIQDVSGHGFDLIVSRAFASLSDFVTGSEKALADHGVWGAMKGKVPDEEIALLPPTVEAFHVEPLTVPGLLAERCLVWIRRRATSSMHRPLNESGRKQTGNGPEGNLA